MTTTRQRHRDVEIGGKTYSLRLTMLACRKLQAHSGKALFPQLGALTTGSIEDIAQVLWASMLWRDPTFTLEKAWLLLDTWMEDDADIEEIGGELMAMAKDSRVIHGRKSDQAAEASAASGGEGKEEGPSSSTPSTSGTPT